MKREPRKREASRLRRWSLWLHGWLGISIGAWLAVVGLTGSILIWRPEVEPRLNVRLHQVQPQAQKVSLQQVFEVVRAAYPQQRIDRIALAREANLAHEIRLRGPKSLSVFVDPYSGRILGQQAYRGDFFGVVDELHVRMLASDVGHTLVGLGGAVLLLMATSGLWLWWPRRGAWKRAFVPNLRSNWRGRNSELHRVMGGLLCALFIGEALTGMALVWAEPTRSLLAWMLPSRAIKKPAKAAKGTLMPLDVYTARAQAAFPDAEISRLNFPKKTGSPLIVRLQQPGELNPAGNTSVLFDPVSGKILQVEASQRADTPTRTMNLRYPIHTGLWGGWPTRVLYSLLGLTLLGFYVSGLILWWHKRRKKRGMPQPSQREPLKVAA